MQRIRPLMWLIWLVLGAAALALLLAPPRPPAPHASPAGSAEGRFPSLPPGVTPALVSDRDLVERAQELDGQWVMFQGEALGDLMVRGNTAWLNVGGAHYAIGILMPRTQAAKVKVLGSYRFHGDTVRVVGLFHRADPNEGGDLDVVASSVEVVKPGSARAVPRPGNRVYAAAGLSLLALALFLAARLVRRRSEGGEGHLGNAGQ